MKRLWILSLPLALLFVLAIGGIASAHEHREVGDYTFVVGFLSEPAFLNQVNGIDLRITDKDGKGVEGLEKTLQAQVMKDGKTMPVTLEGRWKDPGAYNGYFIPTKAGPYIFHFTGEINGATIDETFESSPEGFDEVDDTAALEFPEKLTPPQELTSQLEAVQGASAQVKAAQDAATAAQASAQQAQTFGIIGIVVGIIGIGVGGYALMRRK
jgi:hypothetical protein